MGGPETEAQHPMRAALRAVKLIDPVRQGSCDNLCGLYAILNALALTLAAIRMLTADEMQALFVAGTASLDRHGALAACLRGGVPIKLWRVVAADICAAASTLTGILLVVERPFAHRRPSRASAFTEVEAFVRDQHAPIISLEGVYSHYSVICGYSPASFRLFDSNGLKRIGRAACGIGADREAARYWLDLQAMMVIRAGLPKSTK